MIVLFYRFGAPSRRKTAFSPAGEPPLTRAGRACESFLLEILLHLNAKMLTGAFYV
jgi:hypothetical protein